MEGSSKIIGPQKIVFCFDSKIMIIIIWTSDTSTSNIIRSLYMEVFIFIYRYGRYIIQLEQLTLRFDNEIIIFGLFILLFFLCLFLVTLQHINISYYMGLIQNLFFVYHLRAIFKTNFIHFPLRTLTLFLWFIRQWLQLHQTNVIKVRMIIHLFVFVFYFIPCLFGLNHHIYVLVIQI